KRLEGMAHIRVATGAPILEDCLVWLDCALVEAYEGGDHTIFVGRVEASGGGEGRPLLWFGSDYRLLAGRTTAAARGGRSRPRRAGRKRAPARRRRPA
ncbi:MAG TPA: flavin reductase family protein, partial [Candidatus Polarisedimenticolia bacterium]|nr:flavin reductase family protein [Candidatus Polarisedimenticolia bacterium]